MGKIKKPETCKVWVELEKGALMHVEALQWTPTNWGALQKFFRRGGWEIGDKICLDKVKKLVVHRTDTAELIEFYDYFFITDWKEMGHIKQKDVHHKCPVMKNIIKGEK